MVRSNGMARRALEILDKRMDTSSGVGPAGRGVGKGERSAPEADANAEAQTDAQTQVRTEGQSGSKAGASAKPETPEAPEAV
jgi:hypothetical protein